MVFQYFKHVFGGRGQIFFKNCFEYVFVAHTYFFLPKKFFFLLYFKKFLCFSKFFYYFLFTFLEPFFLLFSKNTEWKLNIGRVQEHATRDTYFNLKYCTIFFLVFFNKKKSVNNKYFKKYDTIGHYASESEYTYIMIFNYCEWSCNIFLNNKFG